MKETMGQPLPPIPSYTTLREHGVVGDTGMSLHAWHEDYYYNGEWFTVYGSIGTDSIKVERKQPSVLDILKQYFKGDRYE